MEFISLHDIMDELSIHQAGDEPARYSRAAAGLYQAMHNSDERPRWFETTKDGLTLKSENTDGMAMLMHMAGWKSRDMREFLQYVDECTEAERRRDERGDQHPADGEAETIDPVVHRSYSTAGGMYDMKNYIKSMREGFDRAELIPFLDANGIDHNLDVEPASPQAATDTTTPSDDWANKARAITDKIALERYGRGEQEITARNICDAVKLELAKDFTTHGKRGPRSGGNIRSVALKGWKFIPPTGTNGTSGTNK